jgi:hypothetical protein
MPYVKILFLSLLEDVYSNLLSSVILSVLGLLYPQTND